MKTICRIFIILSLLIAFAFSATFPKGMISFKDGTELEVKKLSIEDNFVFYRYEGEKQSALLDEIEIIKVRGLVENALGYIFGTGAVGFWGYNIIKNKYYEEPLTLGVASAVTVGTTTLAYFAGKAVGRVVDPWKEIYSPEILAEMEMGE